MWNPFKRKKPPPLTRFPEEWVTLLFTVKDKDTGHYRNAIEHFNSEEEAARHIRGAPPEWLEGFKGAYREIPGFLQEHTLPPEATKPIRARAFLPAAPELDQEEREELAAAVQELEELRPLEELEVPTLEPTLQGELERHREELELERGMFSPFVVLSRSCPAVSPQYAGGFKALPGAHAAAFLETDSGELAADVYQHVTHYPKAKP